MLLAQVYWYTWHIFIGIIGALCIDFISNSLSTNDSQLGHIFGDRLGHLPDTPENRQLLVDVANDDDNYLGTDKYGNEWHARQESDGSQTWTTSRGGTIQNGGQNNPPHDWDDDTGLNNNPFKKR